MGKGLPRKRKTTERDILIALERSGIRVSEEEAKEILEFLYTLAEIAVEAYITNEDKSIGYDDS
jgi:hypothetical protein